MYDFTLLALTVLLQDVDICYFYLSNDANWTFQTHKDMVDNFFQIIQFHEFLEGFLTSNYYLNILNR